MAFPIELQRPLVVFDIESTGISPRRDRIIELAAVKVMPGGEEVRQCWLLNPTVHIPAETTAVHGIADEDGMTERMGAANTRRIRLTVRPSCRAPVADETSRNE